MLCGFMDVFYYVNTVKLAQGRMIWFPVSDSHSTFFYLGHHLSLIFFSGDEGGGEQTLNTFINLKKCTIGMAIYHGKVVKE